MLLRGLLQHAHRQTVTAGVAAIPEMTSGFLTSILHAQDAEIDATRIGSDYIHVSSLLEFCPRRHVVAVRDEINIYESTRSCDRVLWAIGKGIEAHVRKQLLARFQNIGCVGEWSCPCKRVKYEGMFNPNAICVRCGHVATHYDEFTLIDHEAKVAGHPDFIFMASGRLHVLEIKSMNKKDFDLLTKAVPNHIFQASSYRKMLAARGTVPVDPHVIILYVCKDYSFKGSPYHEFSIDATSPEVTNSLDLAWQNARIAKQALEGSQLPTKHPSCLTPSSPMARGCAACVNCFSRA